MKKLLVLLISLCLVTNALAVIEYSIQLEGTGGHEVLGIIPSDVIYVDIFAKNTTAGQVDLMNAGQIDITISGPASFLQSQDITYGNSYWPMFADPYNLIAYPTSKTMRVTVGYLPSSHQAILDLPLDAIVLDHIGIHYDGIGEVTVAISAVGEPPYGNPVYWDGSMIVEDTNPTIGAGVLIREIPEPITVALLGLGGLFLRRRQ